ncbi:UNVERIFIED_CONTAM: hypothetical protein RMT77_000013 [Armadillidium vulgare]
MSGFDEILGTKIQITKKSLGTEHSDSSSCYSLGDSEKQSLNIEQVFPEFTKLLEEPDGVDDDSQGCPIPGTPEEDEALLAMDPILKEDELRQRVVVNREESHDDDLDLSSIAQSAFETAEELVHKVWEEVSSWKVQPFSKLPKWLQDNDFLHHWHRPPLPSFAACFKSIFRIHTETGNIWTHLLGCVAFIGVMVYFLCGSSMVDIDLQEKLVFTAFFIGAIVCLGLSFTFHTVSCHSEFVGKLFCKLDYCGIALLIMGSFVPWLYYGFYCDFQPKLIYLTAVVVLGSTTIIVSLWDKFSTPKYRPLRAVVFLTFGMSGIIPALHYTLVEGMNLAITKASLGWLILMGTLYVIGALLYAVRVPERWFPGKCDLWFHSHQLFHILVIAAAFVHYHGISEMAMYRLTHGDCAAELPELQVSDPL